MNRVRAFFVDEATECLDEVRRELADPPPDAQTVYAAVRRLRGSAQMARFGELADAAWFLEEALRSVARTGAPWNERLDRQVAEAMTALNEDVEAVRAGQIEQDEREPPMDEQDRQDVEGGDIIPMGILEYQGADALERALELREPLEDVIKAGDPPGPILDELFDLIHLGTK